MFKKTKIKNPVPPATAFDNALFSWSAPEYVHHEKGFLWKIIVPGLWLILVIYALFSAAWTFAVSLLIFAGVYWLIYHEKPEHIPVKISRVGIKIGSHEIPFNHIRAFWILYQPPFLKQLQIRTILRFTPDILISLQDQDPAEIREYLASQIQEWEGRDETISEIFIRVLKL